jgi:hypothetical protein
MVLTSLRIGDFFQFARMPTEQIYTSHVRQGNRSAGA